MNKQNNKGQDERARIEKVFTASHLIKPSIDHYLLTGTINGEFLGAIRMVIQQETKHLEEKIERLKKLHQTGELGETLRLEREAKIKELEQENAKLKEYWRKLNKAQ